MHASSYISSVAEQSKNKKKAQQKNLENIKKKLKKKKSKKSKKKWQSAKKLLSLSLSERYFKSLYQEGQQKQLKKEEYQFLANKAKTVFLEKCKRTLEQSIIIKLNIFL